MMKSKINMDPEHNIQHPASCSEEVLIKVEGVSKKFCKSLKRSLWYGVKDLSSELLARNHGGNGELRRDEFWAVKDVSFELKRGDCLGLIGRNGAGKTTLLRMLNGLIKPEAGRIEMRGRVGALIALGAGFNPILTGRENIYVNASVLGLSKREIDDKIEGIIDFAEIQDFIDAPVQSYSSGMRVRLGFAVATALEPDILILDEVLAVGDAAFRAKCYNRIGQLQKNASVIFVSHTMDQVARTCSKVIVMAKGVSVFCGGAAEGIEIYERENSATVSGDASFLKLAEPINKCRVQLTSPLIRWTKSLDIGIEIESKASLTGCAVYGVVYDATGIVVASFVTSAGKQFCLNEGLNRLCVRVASVPLANGGYRLGLALSAEGNMSQLIWSYKECGFRVESSVTGFSPCRLPAEVTTTSIQTTFRSPYS